MKQVETRQQQSDGLDIPDTDQAYLDCLQALAQELECAMQSLALGTLSTFDESVSRQLRLCSDLANLATQHRSCHTSAPAAQDREQGNELTLRAEGARTQLLKLNQNYSALLNHSRRTLQIFAGLAQSYSGYSQAGLVVPPSRTWSSTL